MSLVRPVIVGVPLVDDAVVPDHEEGLAFPCGQLVAQRIEFRLVQAQALRRRRLPCERVGHRDTSLE